MRYNVSVTHPDLNTDNLEQGLTQLQAIKPSAPRSNILTLRYTLTGIGHLTASTDISTTASAMRLQASRGSYSHPTILGG